MTHTVCPYCCQEGAPLQLLDTGEVICEDMAACEARLRSRGNARTLGEASFRSWWDAKLAARHGVHRVKEPDA